MSRPLCAAGLGLALLFSSLPVAAQGRGVSISGGTTGGPTQDVVYEQDGMVVAADASGTYVYTSWAEYFGSPFFQKNGKRCGAAPPMGGIIAATSDCTNTLTNIQPQYDPSGTTYTIPVVVHVIRAKNGTGNLSDALVQSQIDVLNEDFRAQAGSLGAGGTGIARAPPPSDRRSRRKLGRLLRCRRLSPRA